VPYKTAATSEITFTSFSVAVITISGIRPTSWNFRMKEASVVVGIYTNEKRAPKTDIATEIAPMSISGLGYYFYFRFVPDAVLRRFSFYIVVTGGSVSGVP